MLHKITPYPWRFKLLNHRYYIESIHSGLPMVGTEGSMRAIGRDKEEHENNANLMAASPELLECLFDLLGCSELNMDDMEAATHRKIKNAFNVMQKHNLNKLLWEPDNELG